MRTLSGDALTKLTTQYGIEPITIVEIQWADNGPRAVYAGREIPVSGFRGKILEISDLDDVINISDSSDSQQISITLDDTDGSLKNIMESVDIHKRPCWVYQWFEGLDIDDRFLLFKGVINSPVEWNEGDRTLRFDVLSKIEDVEVGFSIEEGIFPDPPEDLIGRPWPLAFGTVTNMPALTAKSFRQGTLGQGTGIHDFTIPGRLAAAEQLVCPATFDGWAILGDPYHGYTLTPSYKSDTSCLQQICVIKESLNFDLQQQLPFEISPIIIYGGEKFPQNTAITLDINGGKFTGSFNGNVFSIVGRLHPQNDGTNHIIKTTEQQTVESNCPAGSDTASTDDALAAISKLRFDAFNKLPTASFFWAAPGAKVTMASQDETVYIANLLPSTILRVAAFREISGIKQLLTIPSDRYTIRETDYSGPDNDGYPGVMEIVFTKPNSLYDLDTGGGWSDDIYVTLTSSVGPNTVDILTWFIETYTQYSIDSTTFDEVHDLIDNYPMHFWLKDRKNLIDVLREIAEQARCAMFLKDDVFYIRYVSLEPTPVDTIDISDISQNSLVLTHTPTEDLVTRFTVDWQEDYAIEKPNKIILRHNVIKYGMHKEDYDYYCFNIFDLVLKSASFWMVRRANTWRIIKFKTPLHKLNLEVYDPIALDIPYFSPETITGIITKASYNSGDNTIDFEVWTPVKSGTTTPYNFAWPADIEETDLFPTVEEQDLKLAGSGTAPNFKTIAPPGHPLDNTSSNFGGFSLACNGSATSVDNRIGNSFDPAGCRPDHGKKKPSDRGDTKPEPKTKTDSGGGSGAGPTPPATSCDPCEALREAKQALAAALDAKNEAEKAAQQAADAANSAGGSGQQNKKPSDALKNLPKRCGECGWIVSVSWAGNVAAESGGESICEPDGAGNHTESFCFATSGEAQEFEQTMKNSLGGPCPTRPPCRACGSVFIAPGVDCEGKTGMLAHSMRNGDVDTTGSDSIVDHI